MKAEVIKKYTDAVAEIIALILWGLIKFTLN